jgi:hypothetical protein
MFKQKIDSTPKFFHSEWEDATLLFNGINPEEQIYFGEYKPQAEKVDLVLSSSNSEKIIQSSLLSVRFRYKTQQELEEEENNSEESDFDSSVYLNFFTDGVSSKRLAKVALNNLKRENKRKLTEGCTIRTGLSNSSKAISLCDATNYIPRTILHPLLLANSLKLESNHSLSNSEANIEYAFNFEPRKQNTLPKLKEELDKINDRIKELGVLGNFLDWIFTDQHSLKDTAKAYEILIDSQPRRQIAFEAAELIKSLEGIAGVYEPESKVINRLKKSIESGNLNMSIEHLITESQCRLIPRDAINNLENINLPKSKSIFKRVVNFLKF